MHFPVCQRFSQAMDEVEYFFCQFPNPWALGVSGMGCCTSKCEKSQNHWTLLYRHHRAVANIARCSLRLYLQRKTTFQLLNGHCVIRNRLQQCYRAGWMYKYKAADRSVRLSIWILNAKLYQIAWNFLRDLTGWGTGGFF